MDLLRDAPALYGAMKALDAAVRESALDGTIRELVLTRASQLNGCAYCIDKHTRDARDAGEAEQRLYGVSAWRETPFYDERERAALALTEALTLPPQHAVIEAAREGAGRVFEPEEYAALVFAIALINGWNAIGVGAGLQPRAATETVA